MDDDRNQLFRQFTRLLTGLQPRAFVMENVSGMVKGKMKLLFAEILAELKACGYRVSVRLLNAMYFGVPQSRQRLIFVGVREDLAAEPGHPGAWGHLVTVRDAFRCLHPQTFAPPARGQSFVLPYIRPGQQASKVVPKNVLAAFIPRLLNPKPMAYAATAPLVKRLVPGKPSPTLTKMYVAYSQTPVHPTEHRFLAAEELSRIASFPDEYEWSGTYVERHERIGNCVPPLFMRAIAEHIRETILSEVSLAS